MPYSEVSLRSSIAVRARNDELEAAWRMHLHTSWTMYTSRPVKGRHLSYDQYCNLLLGDGDKEARRKLSESEREDQIKRAYENATWFCPEDKPGQGLDWIKDLKRQNGS